MAYCAQSDVQTAAGGAERLRELSDLESTGSIGGTTVTAAIAAADGLIDMYIQRRHKVPLASVPEAIKQLSAAEAVYVLKQRRPHMVSPEDIAQHDQRVEFLRDISTGKASVGIDPGPAKSSAVVPEATERDSEEDVSRESLKGFC